MEATIEVKVTIKGNNAVDLAQKKQKMQEFLTNEKAVEKFLQNIDFLRKFI
jgi:hypothetical protein